ncbi:MAG: SDR family oxidoreductase [Pirellulales bacterium]|nr:SDR family oxidoreductase [Pirellulales bacterium]
MSNLDGVHCLIAGGTGSVGEAIVRVFLRAGATVVVPSRTQVALDRLSEYLGDDAASPRLMTVVGNVGDPADAVRVRDEVLSRVGRLDAVVASLGGTWDERLKLVDVPFETWRNYWDSNLSPHFVAARTWLPVLAGRQGSSYTLLGGLSAVMPIAQYGVVSVNSAGQLMLARVLMEEMKDTCVRINQVMFGYIHTRARAAHARPEWITAEEVGEFCAYLASAAGACVGSGVIQLGNRPPRR